MCRSGVTTCNSIFSGSVAIYFVSSGSGRVCWRKLRCCARRHFFCFLAYFFDGADHVESLLRQIVVLAFDDFLEAADSVFDFHILPRQSRELLGDEHRLREELFDFARSCHGLLGIIRKFFDAQNRDDVLHFLVTLQNGFHRARHVVMFLADDARIQNAREAGQRIYGGINAAFDDLAAQVRGGVQVRESCGWRRVGVVIRRNVNGLHGSDRAIFCGRDALLQFADFSVQVRLVADGGWHASEQRGNFRAGLHEAENIINEEQHVEFFFVAEIFSDGEASQSDAQTGTRWFGHLSVDQCAARFFGIPRDDYAGFLHFEPQVVAFAGAFAYARENRDAAVFHCDVVDQFLNQHGLANARAAEQADLSTFQVRLGEVHDLDAGLEHFERRGLVLKQRSRAVNGVALFVFHGAEIIDRIAEDVEHAAENAAADRDGYRLAEIERFHAADQTFSGFHRDATHAAFAEVLSDFGDDVERLGIIETFAGDAHRIVNERKVSLFELDINNWADDFDDVPGF